MRAQVISFHCILKNRIGRVLGSTFNHDVITQGKGEGDLLQGLVEGLKGLKKGEKRKIELSADEAYGLYDLRLVVEVPRRELSKGKSLHVGDSVLHPSWEGGAKTFRVIQTTANSVTLDGNHPLAGQDLIFEIEATAARYATSEEISEVEFECDQIVYH